MLFPLHHISNKNGSRKGNKRQAHKRKQSTFTAIDNSKGTVLTKKIEFRLASQIIHVINSSSVP